MNTSFDKKLVRANLILSILINTVLVFDYFITAEFMLELVFVVGLSLLLILNIVRQLNAKLSSIKFLAYLINGLIILAGLYCLGFLLLLFWGYGFRGSETPLIWTLAFLLNMGLEIVSCFEIMYLSEKE